MKPYTKLEKGPARLLSAYLQYNAKDADGREN
jgi:hypothetical protein